MLLFESSHLAGELAADERGKRKWWKHTQRDTLGRLQIASTLLHTHTRRDLIGKRPFTPSPFNFNRSTIKRDAVCWDGDGVNQLNLLKASNVAAAEQTCSVFPEQTELSRHGRSTNTLKEVKCKKEN